MLARSKPAELFGWMPTAAKISGSPAASRQTAALLVRSTAGLTTAITPASRARDSTAGLSES